MNGIENFNLKIIPIRKNFLEKAKIYGYDDLGQTVLKIKAKGGGPCRDLLRPALPGEALLLASYSPFSIEGPYREYWPIFITATDSPNILVETTWAEVEEKNYFSSIVALRGYCKSETIMDAFLSPVENIKYNSIILFNNTEIVVVHIRFGAYGCFGCSLELKEKS